MKSIESVVVAFDGESKCGKTTIINSVAKEAEYQAGVIPGLVEQIDRGEWDISGSSDLKSQLEVLQGRYFDTITTISAGNAFRAAALYTSLLELDGQKKAEFTASDSEAIRELLAEEGINDVLQTDPNVGKRVSYVGKMMGVQALCGTIFADQVSAAYRQNDGANLVVIDARDPVGHLRRNKKVGLKRAQIHPASIVPIYIDTDDETAARRMGGDYWEKLEEVSGRRHADATRNELPVVKPDNLVYNFEDWLHQFPASVHQTEIAIPYRWDNGERTSLEHIQYFAGVIAAHAQNQAFFLYQSRAAAQGHYE